MGTGSHQCRQSPDVPRKEIVSGLLSKTIYAVRFAGRMPGSSAKGNTKGTGVFPIKNNPLDQSYLYAATLIVFFLPSHPIPRISCFPDHSRPPREGNKLLRRIRVQKQFPLRKKKRIPACSSNLRTEVIIVWGYRCYPGETYVSQQTVPRNHFQGSS